MNYKIRQGRCSMDTKPYFSMHTKLICFLSVCLLIPMLGYCLYSYQYTRTSLGRNYQCQTTDTMEATAQSISSYMEIADGTARSLHFNTEILPLLSLNGQRLSPSSQLQITAQLFNYMQQLYGIIPDASQIHIDAYCLRRILLLTDTFQQYEKEHIYVHSERTAPVPPYETMVMPTHLQYDYNFTNTELNTYSLVVTLALPVYEIPSLTRLIGRLSIDIPIEVIGEMCAPLYGPEEGFFILDSNYNIIFSSDPAFTASYCRNPALTRLVEQARLSKDTVIEGAMEEFHFCVPVLDSPVDWYLIKTTPKSYVYRDADRFFRQSLLVLMLSILCALTFSFFIILKQTRPLRLLTRYTDTIQKGKLDEHLSDYIVYTKNDEIGSLIQSVQKMMYTINHFVIREYQLELANKSSQLKALQAQINPHFIYNTLQCIAAESLETNNLEVYRSITTLGHMMQYSMDTRRSCVELKDEIANCVSYVSLQKMRFVHADVELRTEADPDTLSLPVPKMILQPLVENAFKHGNLLKLPDACVVLRSCIRDGIFHILVEDNGTGIRFDILEQVREQLKQAREELTCQNAGSSDRIGLCNVYMRLLLLYDGQSSLSVQPNENCGTTVHIEIAVNAMAHVTTEEPLSR